MHLIHYSLNIITSDGLKEKECHFLRDVLNTRYFKNLFLVCSNLCFIGLTNCYKCRCCSSPTHYAPFCNSNLIMLHALRAIQSEHMPYCVLQGHHGLSLQ